MINWIKDNLQSYNATKTIPYIFAVLIPFHLLAIIGISITSFGILELAMLVCGWIVFGGIGTAMMLHKYFAHTSFVIYKFLKIPLYWIACMSGQGSPIWWSAQHRGLHHAHADTEKDIHSPIKGFWYAYMGWMFKVNYKTVNLKYSIDWLRDDTLVWFHKNYNSIILISVLILFLLDPSMTLLTWFYIIPALIGLHTDSQVNSFAHSNWIGYRNFDTKDNSRNISYLGWLGWGQGWHNNHHARPKSFDFGTNISKNSYEFDPCLLLLPLVSPISEVIRIWKGRYN